MLRPVPTRLGTLRFGADPASTGPRPGFYVDTGGYAWELSPNGTLTAIASPGAPAAFAPWSPGYAAILAKITTGKTTWTREQAMKSAIDQGWRDLSGAQATEMVTTRPTSDPATPPGAASTPANPSYTTGNTGVPASPAMPGWVLPVAALTGATGLVLVLFPDLLSPAPPPPPRYRYT